MLPTTTITKQEELKIKLIERFIELVEEKQGEIESGIEEGLYEEEDNKETLKGLKEDLELAAQLLAAKPEIYAYVSGGVLQGISATCKMEVNIFDQDNYEAGDNETTPDEWQADIDRLTEQNEIKGVY